MASSAQPVPPSSTEIPEVLRRQLVPSHLRFLNELLALELANLMQTRRWALRHNRAEPLTVAFLLNLHRRLFTGIWKWAGQLRRTDHVEGARWPTIGIELNDLVGEVRFWRERRLYPPDEIALRFHHRLQRIRPWEGGNRIHAMLIADKVATSMQRLPFSWQQSSITSITQRRDMYLRALRDADDGVLGTLLDFARGA